MGEPAFQPPELLLRGVFFSEVERLFDHRDDGIERTVLGVGRSATFEPAMWGLFEPPPQLVHQTRLANARLARNEHRLAPTFLRLFKAVQQQPQLLLATHEGSQPRGQVQPTSDATRLEHPVHPDRLLDALQLGDAPVRRHEHPRHQAQRRVGRSGRSVRNLPHTQRVPRVQSRRLFLRWLE